MDCVKELIATGANMRHQQQCAKSFTFNKLLFTSENIECVKELLMAGADVNATDGVDTALVVACEKGNEAIVKMLLDNGADVNLEARDGRTALDAGSYTWSCRVPKREIQEGVTRFT